MGRKAFQDQRCAKKFGGNGDRQGATAEWLSVGNTERRARKRNRHGLLPALLVLEDRRLLSTFDVTSTADDGSTGTLRWAVAQANAASSPSTIDFQLSSTPATIALTQGPLELSNTSAAITIDGPGASLLSISGNNASRVFQVDNGVTASLSGLTITKGSATDVNGGGLANFGTVNLADCTISNDAIAAGSLPGSGGGLANSGTATLTDCTITGNSAPGDGGGLYNLAAGGTATLTDCTITDNSAYIGGGIESNGSVTLVDCTIASNSAGGGGGMLAGGSGTATVTDCTISGNSATGGGGLANRNTAMVTGCTISGNLATDGGGVLNAGLSEASLTLTDCAISGNAAIAAGIQPGSGGGLANFHTAILTDCTISGNTAGDGGGLYNYYTATLTACTLSGNTAGDGGGVYNSPPGNNSSTIISKVSLSDTIVAGNSSSIGGTGSSNVTGSYNLIGTGGLGGLIASNQNLLSVADPGLAPLADNGGPTETMALLPASPAIGAGTAVNGVTSDQRGLPLDSPPDIGAYQTQSSQSLSLSFTGLSSPHITYGTARVTFSGTLADGNQAPPETESVQVTLDGVTQSASIGAGGAFSTTFDTGTLSAAGSPYSVSYSYVGDATYKAATGTSTLTIAKATPTVSVSDAGGTYNGKSFPATDTVTGIAGTASATLEGATLTLIYYAGTSAKGPPLSGPPSQGGTYTVVASFPGSNDYEPAQSEAVTFTINPAASFLSLNLSATSIVFGQSVTVVATVVGAGATPSGTVTFFAPFNPNPLGTVSVDASGRANLTTSGFTGSGILGIIARYSGDADLAAASATSASILVALASVQMTLLPPQPVFNNKNRLVSVSLSVEVTSSVPGASLPSGIVDFQLAIKSHGRPHPVRPTILGQAVVQGGRATLSLPAKQVLNKMLAVSFSGSGFDAPIVNLPRLTPRMLKLVVRRDWMPASL